MALSGHLDGGAAAAVNREFLPRVLFGPGMAGWVDALCASRVISHLSRIRHGELELTLPDGRALRFGEPDPEVPEIARLVVHDLRLFRRLALGGDIVFGEAFVDGDLSSPDLLLVLRRFIANEQALQQGAARPAHWLRWLHRLDHWRRRNHRRGSARNVQAHYDLGNAFFGELLDETMLYSCAIFQQADESLADAQRRKVRRLLDGLQVRPGMRLLEIGSGWGEAAIIAAREYGCLVTTITLSPAQRQLALQRVAAAGLSERVRVEIRDYREMVGEFDRILSIEMIEAVGHRYLPQFFATCDRLLANDGVIALQAITIPDQRYENYRRQIDWIQRYIFPGAQVPSLTVLCEAMTNASRLIVERLDNIGPHYAPTLAAWRRRLLEKAEPLSRLGYDPRFRRMFEYYLTYCEAGFASRYLNTMQIFLTRPRNLALRVS